MAFKSKEAQQAYCREFYSRPGRREEKRARERAHGKTIKCKLRKQKENATRLSTERTRKLHQELRKRWNNQTKGRKNHRKPWIEQEIALLWNTNYTTKEIAALLNRTISAVANARDRFAAHAPKSYVHNGNRKAQLEGLTP